MGAPKRRYRIVRGAQSDYDEQDFATREERDTAARRYTEGDGETVMTMLWDESHPQDELNQGWAMDGVVRPHEEALAALDFETGERISAQEIEPGDTVTVWAYDSAEAFLRQERTGFRHGTVEAVVTVQYQGFTLLVLAMDDERELVAVPQAVTTRHAEEAS